MNINRLNYENYFLLYVDGELSATEMQAVDRFASENEDLVDELTMLLQTKLPEEAYHFENKSSLLRTTSEHINSINCEEKFLFFIDDEITAQEKEETLKFVSTHPEYQELFETLNQAKLPIEHISFPDKESLFRTEESTKPVILLQWWKLAVAAAIFGIIAMVGILVPYNNSSSSVAKSNKIAVPYELKKSVKEQPVLLQNKIEDQTQIVQTKRSLPGKSFNALSENKSLEKFTFIEPIIAKIEITKHLDAQETIAVNTPSSNTINDIQVLNKESNNHASLLIPVNSHPDETVAQNYIKPAVYKELDTDDERKSLYVGSVEINKDKLRGFLRKASSLFKGKNKNEEEKTEISNSHTLE
ncbi:MAG: hypothetical protein WCR66_07200 [Bacteroidota bacterium]